MTPYRKPNVANMIKESSVLTKIYGTGYKIAVPHHILHNAYKPRFFVGHVEFEVIGYGSSVKPLTPIPESWFVDLNA